MTQPLPDQVPASEPDPLDLIARASDLASLDEELNQLPQKYRDVLVMSYFAQQTNQEIADQLNESKGAVDGRIRDARRMLRVRLARRGVEVGVLAVATAYVQSSASAATPALIQKAISLGAPGMVSQELAALNSAEVAQLKLLTSTGIPFMSKLGLTIAAGLVVATGLWGMTHLVAFQDTIGAAGVATVDAVDGDVATNDEIAEEFTGQAEASSQAEPPASAEVSAVAVSAVATTPSVEAAPETPSSKQRRPLTGAVAEFSRRSERDAERRLNELMQTDLIGNYSYPGENPLSDILQQLSSDLTNSQGDRVMIRPDLMAFQDDAIALQDVTIVDIEVPNGFMKVGSFLDYILSQTNPKLTWIAKDELLLITTMSAAESDENMFLRSYDISRLREISQLTVSTWNAGDGQQGGGGGFFSVVFEPTQFGGGIPSATPQKKKISRSTPPHEESEVEQLQQDAVITWEAGLMQTIQDLTAPPCHWYEIDGEGGKLTIAGNRLIVRQSRKGHEQVVAVLEQLEMAADDAAEEQ